MKKIFFVILCYQAFEKTEKCLSYLTKLKVPKNYQMGIVLVDNASPDGSGKRLQNYQNDEIKVIINKENLGFAKGNNIGYREAKKDGANIIILSNNDVYIKDENFLRKLINDYKDTKFDIAGPQIISLVDNNNQNPVARQYYSINDINSRILKLKILKLLSYINLDVALQKLYRKRRYNNLYLKKADSKDFQLHGAFIIFGEQYIKRYDGIFDKTFMYGEENIIKYISIRDKLKLSYLDNLMVEHEEGSSTIATHGKHASKRRFYYRYNIESCIILKKMALRDGNYRW